MRQTSLLDSFVKKATSQNTAKKQSNNQSSPNNNQAIKQNNQNANPKYIPPNLQKPKIPDSAIKIPPSQQQSKQYSPQKMEIQGDQQKFPFLNQDSQSPQLRKLKKQTNQPTKKESKPNPSKVKNTKRKKQSDAQFSAYQQNSQLQQFNPDPQDQQSFNCGDQEQYGQKLPKRKLAPKRNTLKSQKKNNQSNLTQKFVSATNNIQNKNSQEHCEDTVLFDRTKFSDATPQWAIPGHQRCKDKYGISCKDPQYDETTLQVPDYAWKDFSGPMKQYWKIKSQNFDKIIFFKLGKFYELFYEDALIGNQLLDLKWMGTKMHVGFPEKSLDRYTQQLVKQGLKVVVVQQMETPQQMNKRLQQAKSKKVKQDKTLRRQVTQILTKGTFQSEQQQQVYLPNYLMTVYRYEQKIAYTLLEIGTNSILMGIVQGFQQFKTVLYQTRPAQIVYDPDNLPKEYVDIMKQNLQNMILSKLMNKQNLWHHLNATNQLDQLQDKKVIKKPLILQTIQKLDAIPRNLMMSTLSGLFDYLHKIYKFQYVLSTAKFKFYQKEKALTHMVLDSQALQHLQIFQTSIGQTGSLFQKIDRTKSKFGRRLFRRWMTSPLLSTYHINQRLDAVSDLRQIGNQLQRIQSTFNKLPDLQKMCNRLYKYSVSNTAAATAVYFSDLNTTRLQQFDNFMKNMELSLIIFKILQEHSQNYKSKRLRKLITLNKSFENENCPQKLIYFEDQQFEQNQQEKTQNGLLPDIIGHLQSFKQYVIWKQGKPYPKQGIIQLYDDLLKKQKQIKKKLDNQLQNIRLKFKCPNINYAHIKQRYQVQIPERKDIKIPKQFNFSSKKQGFSRYLVPQVQQIVTQLQVIQKGVKMQMNIFVTFFFEQFKLKQNVWERYINILAEIDCFCGMTQYSKQKKTSRPKFVNEGYQVVQAVHPSLSSLDFIPNDISFQNPIIILTGPNMGGKSTILRTSCLLAIMAQMGCYVPCKSYKAGVVDRIFTRIGASDKLQAGKSTFFIEMEQTKSIVNNATQRSLAIIDELGRGTATYDGMALAHSVLNYLISRIKCKCFFATHYHSLTQQFASMPGTCLKMMDYEIIKGEQDRIQFLYKLVNGRAEKSFGLNVAQLVGLPKQLIKEARIKSDEMHEQIQKKKKRIKLYEQLDKIFDYQISI